MMDKTVFEFRASNLDLLLAVIASIEMPLLCGFLYDFTAPSFRFLFIIVSSVLE